MIGRTERPQLSTRARAGLDVARAAAAIYVVLHHCVRTGTPVDLLFSFGQEAVLVFFFLSGFVIFFNEKDRSRHPRGYYLRRLRRIYPTMLVAMVVSTILWAMGLISAEFSWSSLVGTLFALQDIPFLKPGVIVDPYLGNSPLWSLSYEIFFYAVFPAVMVIWRRSERVARWAVPAICFVALGSFLALPNHFSLVVSYFMIWWAGAMVASLYMRSRLRLREAQPELWGLAVISALALAGVIAHGFAGLGYFPFLLARHFVFSFALLVVLLLPTRRMIAGLASPLGRAGTAVASISYGLYVVHYPVLVQTQSTQSWWIAPALVLTVILAWIADRWVPSLLPSAPKT